MRHVHSCSEIIQTSAEVEGEWSHDVNKVNINLINLDDKGVRVLCV